MSKKAKDHSDMSAELESPFGPERIPRGSDRVLGGGLLDLNQWS